MIRRIDVLERNFGDGFVLINEQNYKSESADALVLLHDEVDVLITKRLKEEIPYIQNNILKKHLPKKFHNDLILDEYKELSKFDHTVLSNFILDENIFQLEMLTDNKEFFTDLILVGSEMKVDDGYYIFYSEIN